MSRMRRLRCLSVGVVVTTLAMAGCASRSNTTAANSATATAGSASAAASSQADFGTLKNVCKPGTPASSTSQGVTATEIKLGVFTDMGFTKNPELVDAAKVFAAWCNAAGGINGRKIVPVTRDAAYFADAQQVLASCQSDFADVGGSAALDDLGVKNRLTCLLPEFPAQPGQILSTGADLQVIAGGASVGYAPYADFYSWLIKEAYPDSADAVGVISGDSPITKVIADQLKEQIPGLGGKVSYSDLYPATGVSDWTPYAQAIKSKKVKGLVFNGDFASLAKLEQVLTNIGYKLDWIDTNNNAYGPAFIKLAGSSVLAAQNNFADIAGVYPPEKASSNPATQQVLDLYSKYDPTAQITLPALRAFSAWLLFATAASDCITLTRTCVYQNAMKQTGWTGGGLQAPVNLTSTTQAPACFNAEKATATGWVPADFKPNTGAYRCDSVSYKFTGNYGKPLTLADVGKTMADVK